MSLIETARKAQADRVQAKKRNMLDRIYDTLPPNAQTEMVEMMGDPSLDHSAILTALMSHPAVIKAGLTISDNTLGRHRNNGWEPS